MNKSLQPVALTHDAYWAIEPNAAKMIWAQLGNEDAASHLASFVPEPNAYRGGTSADEKPYEVTANGVAIIPVCGPMTKSATSWGSGCSTVVARRMVRLAANDPDVKSIVMRFDSPGGSVSGTADLGADVARAAAKKEVVGYIEDQCCSAALWVAAQCSRLYANGTAIIGSIGVYTVAYDSSKLHAKAGVEVHVISTGPLKGGGIEGAAVTDEQLSAIQKTIDDLNSHFLSAIAKGRDMSRASVELLATGEVWVGAEAMATGLIDGIDSFDHVVSSLASAKLRPAMRASSAEDETDLPQVPVLTAMRLEDNIEAVLIAVRDVRTRVAEVKALRDSQDRPFSQDRLAQFKGLTGEVETLSSDLTAFSKGLEPKDDPGTDSTAKDNAARLRKTLLSLALAKA